MNILGLQLQTTDLDGQVAFYRDFLQLPLVEERPDFIAFQAGKTKLVFAAAEMDTNPTYYFAFGVPEAQLADIEQRARNARVTITHAHDSVFLDGNQRGLYVQDKGGNLVGFVTFPRPPEAVTLSNGMNIYGVAEVGLAVQTLDEALEQLTRRLGTEVHAITGSGAIAGDSNGVFRLARQWESWFPGLAFRAEIAPLSVTVEGMELSATRLGDLPYYIQIANLSQSAAPL